MVARFGHKFSRMAPIFSRTPPKFSREPPKFSREPLRFSRKLQPVLNQSFFLLPQTLKFSRVPIEFSRTPIRFSREPRKFSRKPLGSSRLAQGLWSVGVNRQLNLSQQHQQEHENPINLEAASQHIAHYPQALLAKQCIPGKEVGNRGCARC